MKDGPKQLKTVHTVHSPNGILEMKLPMKMEFYTREPD